MSTTVKKYKIQQLQDNNDMLELHPETDADIVNYSKTISGTAVTTVKGALDKIVDGIGVTGVKGNAEQSYRTGNVNITPANIGAVPNSSVSTAVPSSSSSDDQIPTSKAVWTAIDNLPAPMVFKGTLGTGGTITSLPTAASGNEGYTYKVITAGTYASTAAKVGDVFVSNGSSWVLIPAGDDVEDTWRGIKINGTQVLGNGISTGDINITSKSDNITESNVGVYFDASTNTFVLYNDSDMILDSVQTNKLYYAKTNTSLNRTYYGLDIYEGYNNHSFSLKYRDNYEIYMGGGDGILRLENNNGSDVYSYLNLTSENVTIEKQKSSKIVLENGYILLSVHDDSNNRWLDILKLNDSGEMLYNDNEVYVKPSTGIPSTDLATSGVTAGTYSAVTVNNKGIATAGGQMVEVGSSGQTTPSASLAVGGLFFKIGRAHV